MLVLARRLEAVLRTDPEAGAPYSEKSVAALDRILAARSADRSLQVAAYFGEIVCRNLGACWVAPNGLESETEPHLRLDAGGDPVFVFETVSRGGDRPLELAYRSLRPRGAPPALTARAPTRRRWLEVWIADAPDDRRALLAALTELMPLRSAEFVALLQAPPAQIGRFDDPDEGWRLALRLARMDAQVQTRAVLVGP